MPKEGDTGEPHHAVEAMIGVVRKEDCILVIRRADNGAWEPPTGWENRIGRDTMAQTVEHMILERTGVIARVVKEYASSYLRGLPSNPAKGSTWWMCHLCDYKAGEPTLTPEITAAVWLPLDEAADRISASHFNRIADTLRSVGDGALRSYEQYNANLARRRATRQ